MKEFAAFRTTLQESIEDLEEHSVLQGAMPPNILILRRKTVRLFPGGTMVALYYNDKLDQYFSIPYGGDVETTITPASLKEEEEEELDEDAPKTSQEKEIERYNKTAALWKNRKQRWSAYKASTPKADLQKEELNEDAISHLTRVKNFETNTSLRHKDGSQTKVDPTTATMLLKVHGALQPDNQQKFAHHLEHSKQQFNKMLDFGWRQVK